METLGERVKGEREARKWTQAELAALVKKAGFESMSQGGIAQIERRGNSQPKCIVQLAAVFGVTPKWLQTGKGEKHPPKPRPVPAEGPQVAIRSYVGAGEEIMPIDEDALIDFVPAPPGMEGAEATLVRGRSMVPLYHDGDVLFHRRMELDPARLRDEVVVAQVKDGHRFVKLLRLGSRKGLFTLVSINPDHKPIRDQALSWVAPIEWVRKRKRF
jgi:phage repressor protein C with HTH and peptisase S24 domain